MTVCKFCQTPNLRWNQVNDRWRLEYADGSPHLCRPNIIAKQITQESVWNLAELKKWEAKHPPEPMMDFPRKSDGSIHCSHPSLDFLDSGDPRPGGKKGKIIEELIP
jgi:hypothetical protein